VSTQSKAKEVFYEGAGW